MDMNGTLIYESEAISNVGEFKTHLWYDEDNRCFNICVLGKDGNGNRVQIDSSIPNDAPDMLNALKRFSQCKTSTE